MAVILALDYGVQRIGLALTDPDERHALAHDVFPGQPPAAALEAIQRLVHTAGVTRLVVGFPRTLTGDEGPQAQAVKVFGDTLTAATRLPVEYVDERFTSRDAERIAAEKGTAPDAEAARLILETWLARRSPTLSSSL